MVDPKITAADKFILVNLDEANRLIWGYRFPDATPCVTKVRLPR